MTPGDKMIKRYKIKIAGMVVLWLMVGVTMAQNVIGFGDNWCVDKTLLPKNFRFIYNSDGDNMFIRHTDTPEKIFPFVDEVARAGVTSFFMSPNIGMAMNFPTAVGEMVGTGMGDEEVTALPYYARQTIRNLRALVASGHDPLGIVVERARSQGMEVFMSFRLNEVHGTDQKDSYLFSSFWREHPEWRIGKYGDALPPIYKDLMDTLTSPIVAGWLPAGLNFAIPEVRAHRLAQLRELCERYDIDGIEIDFQRFPMFFKAGEVRRNTRVMTDWIREVRAMTREIGGKRNRPLMLSVRVMAKPEQNMAIGLDVAIWGKEKLVDFATASHRKYNLFPLHIKEYRKVLPKDFPLYGSVEIEPDIRSYEAVAQELWARAVDGISLYNFFTPRERGVEPPFDAIHKIGYPSTLQGVRIAPVPLPEEVLIVANKHSNTLSFVDRSTLKVLETIPTGPNPHEIALTPNQRTAYMSSYVPPGNTISVVDLTRRKLIKQISTGAYNRIHGAAVAPDGKHAYFTAGQTGYVVEVDTKTNEITRSIPTEAKISHMVYVSPDDKLLFTGNISSSSVSVIDRASGKLITQIPARKGCVGMSFTPDGKHLWAANEDDGSITIIDVKKLAALETISVPGRPVGVRFTDDGRLALVPSWTKTGELVVIDVDTRKEVKRIQVGGFAIGIELTSDGKRAFVGCEDAQDAEVLEDGSERIRRNTNDSDGVHVIDMKTLRVESVIKTGLGPDPMAMWYPKGG